MKHTIVFEDKDGVGKFTWEVPENLTGYLFCSEDDHARLPYELAEVMERGSSKLRECIQRTIAVQLLLIAQSVILGAKLNRPLITVSNLNNSQRFNVHLMSQANGEM